MSEPLEIYLDNNATTRSRGEVVEAIHGCLSAGPRNPSSAHSSGSLARNDVEQARQQLAALLEVDSERLVFTSGATEANNLAILSLCERARAGGVPIVVTTTIEHSSILEACDYLDRTGARVVRVGVDRAGRIRMHDLFEAIPGADLVSVQWANNETGVTQPIEEIAAFCSARNIPFHSDAAQALGKVPFDLAATEVDLLSVTAHKLHGPPGIGALYARDRSLLTPRQWGGTQEQGIRPGTENLPGIVGFGVACELRRQGLASVLGRMRQLRDELESRILDAVPEASVNGAGAERICNTTNIRFGDLDGQAMVAQLDALGVRCSQSSACTNQRPEPSHVLRAMGLTEEEAWSSIRFAVSEFSTRDDVVGAVEAIKEVVRSLKRTPSLLRSRAN